MKIEEFKKGDLIEKVAPTRIPQSGNNMFLHFQPDRIDRSYMGKVYKVIHTDNNSVYIRQIIIDEYFTVHNRSRGNIERILTQDIFYDGWDIFVPPIFDLDINEENEEDDN